MRHIQSLLVVRQQSGRLATLSTTNDHQKEKWFSGKLLPGGACWRQEGFSVFLEGARCTGGWRKSSGKRELLTGSKGGIDHLTCLVGNRQSALDYAKGTPVVWSEQSAILSSWWIQRNFIDILILSYCEFLVPSFFPVVKVNEKFLNVLCCEIVREFA